MIDRGVTLRQEIEAARIKYNKEVKDLERAWEEAKKLDEEEFQKEVHFAKIYTFPANLGNDLRFFDQG